MSYTYEVLEKAFELAVRASGDYHVTNENLAGIKKIYLELAVKTLDKRKKV